MAAGFQPDPDAAPNPYRQGELIQPMGVESPDRTGPGLSDTDRRIERGIPGLRLTRGQVRSPDERVHDWTPVP